MGIENSSFNGRKPSREEEAQLGPVRQFSAGERGPRVHSTTAMESLRTRKCTLYVETRLNQKWRSTHVVPKNSCHSPVRVVHRLSGTWPAGTVLSPSHIWASDLTAGYSCWILPSYGEISCDRKGKAPYVRSDPSYLPYGLPVLFFFPAHDCTLFKQQEVDVLALPTGVQHLRSPS